VLDQHGPMRRVLICGESWLAVTTHYKGFDQLSWASYDESVEWLERAVERASLAVDFMPDHLVPRRFPSALEELERYSLVILSDIGANSFLLHPDTAAHSRATPNRLDLLEKYVERGGGLLMIGGWLSFTGQDGKARYRGTGVERTLPVTLMETDDVVEVPQGFSAELVTTDHPVTSGIRGPWPPLLGYNRLRLRPDATPLLQHGGDPIAAVRAHGRGRTGVFASDCAPHWAPAEFLNWPGYDAFFGQMARWLARAT